jgi:hypothetical protein
MFKEWAEITYARIAQKRGGDQIRNDENWDFVRLTTNMYQLVLSLTLPLKVCVRKMAREFN